MAELARTPDYLKQHTNLNRRVSNLETGVHPTAGDMGYWDSFGPTQIADASSILGPAIAQVPPTWKRRTGHVYLFGIINGNLTGVSLTDGEIYGTLPEVARPDERQEQIVACTAAPFFCRVRVETDGKLRIIPGAASMGTTDIGLDNITYTVD